MTRIGGTWQNWDRTARVRPQRVERPRDSSAVVRAVRAAMARGLRIKAVGAGQSSSAIAVAAGVLLDLGELSGIVGVDRDRDRARVRVLAGTPIRRMPRLLAPLGLAMETLGDSDRQTIAGAISTGTHGSGLRFGGLATQVVGATVVTGTGDVLLVGEDDRELLPAVALGLGALGILLDVTLQCVPRFCLRASERHAPIDDVFDSLLARAEESDHFALSWLPHTRLALMRAIDRVPVSTPREPRPALRGVRDRTRMVHGFHRVISGATSLVPVATPPINRLVVRCSEDREYTGLAPRVFAQHQRVRCHTMEYAVPLHALQAALREVHAHIEASSLRLSLPMDVRVAAADDLWMSTAYARASGYIAVHRYWRDDPSEYFGPIESIMLAHGGRPHWGTFHSLSAAELAVRYPKHSDFVALRDRLDPHRLFTNTYLERVLGE